MSDHDETSELAIAILTDIRRLEADPEYAVELRDRSRLPHGVKSTDVDYYRAGGDMKTLAGMIIAQLKLSMTQ